MRLSERRNVGGFWQILNALKALGDFLAWNFKSLWDAYKTWLGHKWVLVVHLATIIWGIVRWAVDWIKDLLAQLADAFNFHFDLSLPSQLTHLFQVANYILPVVETIEYMCGYGLLLGVMMVYRHIKSYVPSEFSGGT